MPDIDAYWIWIAAGIMLMLLEFALPGFVIFFFGLAAVLIGVLLFLLPGIPLAWTLLLFAVLSVVLLVLFRKLAPAVFKGKSGEEGFEIDSDDVRGAPATALCDFGPGEIGRVEFRGTDWDASSGRPVEQGERVRAESPRHLPLNVR